MNKKLGHKINGGLAIYYGIGFAVLSITGLILLAGSLIRSIIGGTSFSLWGTVGFAVFSAVMGLIAYAILRVGYEEMEK
jgi:hypothetical protein